MPLGLALTHVSGQWRSEASGPRVGGGVDVWQYPPGTTGNYEAAVSVVAGAFRFFEAALIKAVRWAAAN